jgi:hypothetical protein
VSFCETVRILAVVLRKLARVYLRGLRKLAGDRGIFAGIGKIGTRIFAGIAKVRSFANERISFNGGSAL